MNFPTAHTTVLAPKTNGLKVIARMSSLSDVVQAFVLTELSQKSNISIGKVAKSAVLVTRIDIVAYGVARFVIGSFPDHVAEHTGTHKVHLCFSLSFMLQAGSVCFLPWVARILDCWVLEKWESTWQHLCEHCDDPGERVPIRQHRDPYCETQFQSM